MTIKTILVVDDSPTDRQHLTDLLTKAGYKVTGAASAEEALAKVKQAKPDLVLMDVVMPGQNGFQATRALSTDEATKHIPIIICSTKGQETDKVWGMRQGAQGLRGEAGEAGRAAREDLGARLMAARTSLRDYQRDLSERLQSAKGAANASLLGVQVDDEAWLVDLREAGEVIPVPPVTPLPLTRPWFRGLANIRGNLYSVIDFPALLQKRPVTAGDQARLLLLGDRFRLGAALLIDRSLGLRNPGQLEKKQGKLPQWVRAQYTDAEGRVWKELDVVQLAQHPDFLGVGT